MVRLCDVRPAACRGPALGHVAKTRDWQHWTYVGPLLTSENMPDWISPAAGLWAPDVRRIGDRYVLYFAVTETALNAGKDDSAIGVATAPSPVGPWTVKPEPLVPPHSDGHDGWFSTIDPTGFTDVDGTHYLYWGSYRGGIFAARTAPDGLSLATKPVQVAHSDRYEAPYVVKHGDHYYLMASSANCCAGPSTGYSVFAGRGQSPLGPFLDADGIAMTKSNSGGSIVVTQNGNKWIGAGHNAVFTDSSGQDYLLYHALDRVRPWLGEAGGVNQAMRIEGERVVSRKRLPADDVRLEMDVLPKNSISVELADDVSVEVNADSGVLRGRRDSWTGSMEFPKDGSWRTLVVTIHGPQLRVALRPAGSSDASASLVSPKGRQFEGGPLKISGHGLVTNVVAARIHSIHDDRAPQPTPVGTPQRVDLVAAVNGSNVEWAWIRRPSGVHAKGGAIIWPVTDGDLAGEGASGGLLLRDPPEGDWIAQVKVGLDLGLDMVRNYQQAGMVVINGDDDFIRLGAVAVEGTRIVEYGREITDADGFRSYGGAVVGRPAGVTWLRVAHHVDHGGEHLYRSALSDDGRHWTWGATWTMSAASRPRIGLYTGGGESPAAEAHFSDLIFVNASWPS
ncbi:family 43 glycosylhydrolase [Cutibacterium avidum]|uniref:family 43 glycosylhydrolase n=2 Tax=Cutibacterium avidum TaxID=33010 RepID=UPI0013747637|nr:family 43 glycosylhydrolase [Cutibacterium avidum]MCO6632093.1 family 43 glycosylhydrolase [Cutibacterium avidum]MDQ9080211.1 family 43 glycosylhydrolase [Cutibacterium avidum]MDU5340163.1 family 43 glycosylhydrolase [Cutibacterium avidum]MDU5655832.1 family 43 glycosylhydrolase [Cutibacterium avidum]MDU5831321.1 family 43 glycosylhydrolase [Cutibacterium avidum]